MSVGTGGDPGEDLDQAVADLLDTLDTDDPGDEHGKDQDGGGRQEPADGGSPGTRRVFWWAKAEDSDLQVTWYRLEYFVEWLFTVYAPGPQEIPDCWTHHPDVVQELWALMLAHDAWHTGEQDPLGPIQFAGQWAATRTRLQTRPEAAVCAAGGHRPGIRADDQAGRRASYPVPRPFRWSWPPAPPTPGEHP